MRNWLRYLTLFAGLALLFAGGMFLSPATPDGENVFLSVNNQRSVLEQVSVNGILAVGMTLVILTGGIDLSVGSVLSLCTVVCAMLLMERQGTDFDRFSRVHLLVLPAVTLATALVGGLVARRWPAAQRRRPLSCVGIAVLALAAVGWAWWTSLNGYGTPGVLLVVPLVGGLLGLISGGIIVTTRLQPFIVTLAMMISAVGLAKYVAGAGGRVHSIYMASETQVGAPAAFERLGDPILTIGEKTLRSGKQIPVKLLPVPGLFLLGCWATAAFILHFYPLGRYIYAVGGNEEAARLAGVPVARVKLFAYGASGLLAGLAAVLYCARFKQGLATAGQMKELDAIAAVVIGGTSLMGGRGSILGTLVGIMIFGYLTNILNLRGVSSEMQDILKGVIIVGAAALQTGGLGMLWQKLRRPGRPPSPGGAAL